MFPQRTIAPVRVNAWTLRCTLLTLAFTSALCVLLSIHSINKITTQDSRSPMSLFPVRMPRLHPANPHFFLRGDPEIVYAVDSLFEHVPVTKRALYKQHAMQMNPDQAQVVNMTRWAWNAYRQYGEWRDAIDANDRVARSVYIHDMAYTLVDSLDTLFIMGLHDEFDEASAWAKANLSAVMMRRGSVNFFETTIRSLGGLLSAYYLSEEPHFRDLAIELGVGLAAGIDTELGVPFNLVDLERKTARRSPSLAEANTFQLEFMYLADISRNQTFRSYVERMNQVMKDIINDQYPDGLIPTQISWYSMSGLRSRITFGANGDSYYEYLLKQWLLSNKTDDDMKQRYETVVHSMKTRMIEHTSPSNWTVLVDLSDDGEAVLPRMEHLVCFVPGMLALGYANGMPKSHLTLAEELVETCLRMYDRMETKLAPEAAYFHIEGGADNTSSDMTVLATNDFNLLRPETVESLMILYRITKNEKYRAYGRMIMQAFETYSKVPTGGYTPLNNVAKGPPAPKEQIMESFFLAETLKYLFLLFSDDHILPLNEIVFNTEAHPFPVLAK